MKKYFRIVGYGFLTWLVPFVASFFLYSKEGKMLVSQGFFQSIMIVVGSVTATFLLVSYFNRQSGGYYKKGITVGIVWLAMNWILDLLILLPMSHMPVGQYFLEIGLGYLFIPIICAGMGYALSRHEKIS